MYQKIQFSLNDKLVFLIIIFMTIIIRLPFFFYPFYGDGATFLLMGQSALDGNLLYDSQKSIKPPLLYWFFSFLILLSFKSFFLIHLYASIIIGICGYMIFYLVKKITNTNKAIVISMIYPFYGSFFISGGDILMSEHIVLVPMLLSLIIYVKKKCSLIDFFLIGILLGIASMVRTNIILPSILIALSTLFINNNNLKKKIYELLLISSGGLLILLLCTIPYFYTNNLDLFIKYIFIAPFNFVSSDSGGTGFNRFHTFYTLILKGTYIINFSVNEYFKNLKIIPASLLWFLSAFSYFFLIFKLLNKNIIKNKNMLYKLLVYVSAISLSIILTNKYHNHYLLQIIPFFLICIGFMVSIKTNKFFNFKIINSSLIIILSFCIFLNLIIYTNTDYNFKKTPEYLISSFLNENLSRDEKVFILDNHVIYWFINRYPITSGIHPGDIFKKELLKIHNNERYTPKDEFKKIFKHNPKYLVFSKRNDFEWFINRIDINDKKLLRENFNNYIIVKKYISNNKKIYSRSKSYLIYERVNNNF